jgi:hypothetical protein
MVPVGSLISIGNSDSFLFGQLADEHPGLLTSSQFEIILITADPCTEINGSDNLFLVLSPTHDVFEGEYWRGY